jgi:hypothetical protein
MALRSAPSKDRQIAGVYTAIPPEGKGRRRDERFHGVAGEEDVLQTIADKFSAAEPPRPS